MFIVELGRVIYRWQVKSHNGRLKAAGWLKAADRLGAIMG